MLNIYIGHHENELYSADGWFINQLESEYYTTDFSREVVKAIDNSEIISEYLVISPVLGGVPTAMLSSGVKALIVMKYTDRIVNLVSLGDNCLPYVMKIAMEKDLTVSTGRLINPYRYGYTGEIFILNSGVVVNDFDSFCGEYLRFKDK